MNPPASRRSPSIDALTGDLVKVIRRHDPEWTDANESDPGITLLEVEAWLAEQVYSSRAARPTRTDPYRNFNFRVTFEGSTVASVTRVSALRRSVEVIEHREGGDASSSRRLPGRVVFEPFTLERALDGDRSFETWATQVGGTPAGAPVAGGTSASKPWTSPAECSSPTMYRGAGPPCIGCCPTSPRASCWWRTAGCGIRRCSPARGNRSERAKPEEAT